MVAAQKNLPLQTWNRRESLEMSQLILYKVEKIYSWKMIVCLINNNRKNQYPHGEKWSQTPISFHIPISILMDLSAITQRHFHIIQLKSGPKNISRENMDKK